MATQNSFKRLQQELEQEFSPPASMERNVMHSVNNIDVFGEALNLYLPMLFETVNVWLGGDATHLNPSVPRHFDELPGAGERITDNDNE